MNINHRFNTLIKELYKGNKRAFAMAIGVNPTVVENVVGTRQGKPSYDVLEKIIANANISAEWLFTGKGSMKKESKDIPIAKKSLSNIEGIPLIPLSAMAGVFTDDIPVLEMECERYVVPAFKGADFLMPVKGSSMYPKYNSGDIVACKRLDIDNAFFQWNKVYVLDTDQGPLIKRVKPGSDKDHLLIVSDNEHYEPFELHLNRIYHLALVIGVIRLE